MQAIPQLPRLDRQESMFRQGRTFQPAPGSLGQVALRGTPTPGPFMGQVQTTTTTPTAQPVPPAEPAPAAGPAQQVVQEPAVPPRPRPGLRLAWGRLKKMDAEELAAQLADILERLKARNLPSGAVARIQERLATFSKRATAVETVEITEPEVQQMEAEILSLEEAEAQEGSSATPILIVAGTLAAVGILSALFGD